MQILLYLVLFPFFVILWVLLHTKRCNPLFSMLKGMANRLESNDVSIGKCASLCISTDPDDDLLVIFPNHNLQGGSACLETPRFRDITTYKYQSSMPDSDCGFESTVHIGCWSNQRYLFFASYLGIINNALITKRDKTSRGYSSQKSHRRNQSTIRWQKTLVPAMLVTGRRKHCMNRFVWVDTVPPQVRWNNR